MSSELILKTDNILENYPIADRHSYFQLKNYIIGKEYTLHGKMWQCIRELKTRRDSVDALKLQIEDLNDKLELIDIEKKKLEILNKNSDNYELNELIEKEKVIKLRQLERDKKQLEKNGKELVLKLKNIQEEINYFIHAFESLKKLGDWKDFDDEKAQEAYWNTKLEHELNMRLVLGQPIDTELGKTIETLGDNTPVKKQLAEVILKRQEFMKKQLVDNNGR